MSFFYAVHIGTDVEPSAALATVAQCLPLEWEMLPNSNRHLRGRYSSVHATTTQGYNGIRRVFGFDPCLYIGIEDQSTFEQYHQFIRELMSIIIVVLKHLGGDVVVTENGGPLLLQYLGGQLTLNAAPFRFPEYQQALDLITIPYEMREL